jgi:hypothetical protein
MGDRDNATLIAGERQVVMVFLGQTIVVREGKQDNCGVGFKNNVGLLSIGNVLVKLQS